MGVTGLWRLIEPAGKPVPVETLENKVLAVDISIWLHQMVKGYQDAKGAPLPNAHLMGLFQRLCKLLYFRVKPVFVFDGGFPDLKKETIAKRQDNKTKYNSESERIKRELALLLSKKTAIGSLLGKQISPKKTAPGTSKANNDDDIFKLPALPVSNEESETESEDEESSSGSIVDLHSVDVESDDFKKLPVKEKYDLLIELKETRKMNSWGKLHQLPKKSDNFSNFQMQRLLKRRKVQECLEETEKEMGDTGMSIIELESLLNEEGIDTKIESLPTRRIASNNNTRFILINNVKQALAEAKKKKENEEQLNINEANEEKPIDNKTKVEIEKSTKKDELEDDLQKAIKMSLECVDDHDSSAYTSKTDDSWTSYLSDSDYSHYDSEEEDGCEPPDMTSAKAYILQYCDFTNKAVEEIVSSKSRKSNKHKGRKVERIIEELNKEKSIIADEVEISSEEEDQVKSLSNNEVKILEEIRTDYSKTMMETQASVVYIENPTQEVITLDDSIENNVEQGPIKSKEIPLKIVSQCSDVDEKLENVSIQNKTIMDNTQTSVVCIENPMQEVITLDTSTENDEEESPVRDKEIPIKIESESSDEDEEFEDVPEIEQQTNKPVVELTLKMDEMSDEDIFADVFDKHLKKTTETDFVSSDQNSQNSSSKLVESKITKKNDKIKEPIPGNIEGQNKLDTVESDKATNKGHLNVANVSVSTEKVDSASKIDIINIENETDIREPTIIPDNRKLFDRVAQPEISTETLNSMVTEMENQEQDLLEEKGRLDRIGRNITEQMTKEAQELLQIFGIPYIVAPMEAEAQCAFLEAVKLTDGTITDDSDIWLFGGKTVYKNFFNHKKHVLEFLAERIEKSFNLTREQLVLLALLVGSDYTTGLTGVGPVTALEILASFPFNKKLLLNETSKQGRYQQVITGLQEFKKWVRAGKRTDNTTLKKKLRNVHVTDDFPSIRVVQAYLDPNVEKSEEKFTWGELDITTIRDYAKVKFGWSQNKVDEIMKPVLKRLQDRKSQKNINDYFKKKIEFQSLEDQLSKRVKAAVQRMGPELPADPDSTETKTKTVKKRRTNKKGLNENDATSSSNAGPSQLKRKKLNDEEKALGELGVRVVSKLDEDGKSTIQITIPKSDRVQEIIPQREKDKQSLLQNKMKAIEIFRKSKLDPKNKTTKRKVILPKEKAELSESDSD